MPFASQAPRPRIASASSELGMNGGTVSRCVLSTTCAEPTARANTFGRPGAASQVSTSKPCWRRNSATKRLASPSCPVVESKSISERVKLKSLCSIMSLITSGSFAGPAGELEAILNDCAAPSAGVAAVLCHPHPLYGGTMHTRIVFQAARTLCDLGMPVLRFNFRGVGRSAGAYDHGAGEQQDLEAAMARMRELRPELALLVGGFSFGATMVARLLARSAPTG